MPMRRVISLLRYWREWPPLHEMVASYLGMAPEADSAGPGPQQMSPEEMQRMVSQMNGGI